jgi:hypothetical protein
MHRWDCPQLAQPLKSNILENDVPSKEMPSIWGVPNCLDPIRISSTRKKHINNHKHQLDGRFNGHFFMDSHHIHITGSASPPNWYLFVDSSSTRNWDLVWTASSARDEVVPPLCAWCSCSDSKKLPACELIRLFSMGMLGDLHPSLVELQAKRFWRLEECLG